MATQLFFRNDASAGIILPGSLTKLDGTVAANWLGPATLTTTRGASLSTLTTNTVTGPTNGIEVVSGTTPYHWVSMPLAANVTIAGTITLNLWCAESSMTANVAINAIIERIDDTGAIISQIAKTARATEEALTTNAAANFTVTPTSTAMLKGERIRIRVFGDDGGGTMATGFNFTFGFNGGTAAANGDSYISFTETFSFLTTEPAGTQLFPTTTVATGVAGASVVDEYPVSNRNQYVTLAPGVGSNNAIGQSFTGDGSKLAEAWFALASAASPTGTLTAQLFAHTGTFGTNGTATGTALATSTNSVDISTLPTNPTFAMFRFVFDGTVTMTAGTKYVIAVMLNATVVDATNQVHIGVDTTSPSHPGNLTKLAPTWAGDNFYDTIFQVGGATDEREMWTSRGSGSTNAIVNTVAGPTSPIAWTTSAGGTVIEWYSKQLIGFTLSGLVRLNLRGLVPASTVAGVVAELAVCDNDGSNVVVYGSNGLNDVPSMGGGFGSGTSSAGALTTTDSAIRSYLAGQDITVVAGQRLRLRLYVDDAGSGSLTAAKTATVTYAGTTSAAAGDSYIKLTQSVSIYTPRAVTAVDRFRWYLDDANPNSSTAMAAENVGANILDADQQIVLRVRVQNNDSIDDGGSQYWLKMRKNGGAWGNVDVSVGSSFITVNEPSTQRLASGTGTFDTGTIHELSDFAGSTTQIQAGHFTELGWLLKMSAASMALGDVFEFMVVWEDGTSSNLTNSVTPSLTVWAGPQTYTETVTTTITATNPNIDSADRREVLAIQTIAATTTQTTERKKYTEVLAIQTITATNQNTDSKKYTEVLAIQTITATNQNAESVKRREVIQTTITETNQNADRGRFKDSAQDTTGTVTNLNIDSAKRREILAIQTIAATNQNADRKYGIESPLTTGTVTNLNIDRGSFKATVDTVITETNQNADAAKRREVLAIQTITETNLNLDSADRREILAIQVINETNLDSASVKRRETIQTTINADTSQTSDNFTVGGGGTVSETVDTLITATTTATTDAKRYAEILTTTVAVTTTQTTDRGRFKATADTTGTETNQNTDTAKRREVIQTTINATNQNADSKRYADSPLTIITTTTTLVEVGRFKATVDTVITASNQNTDARRFANTVDTLINASTTLTSSRASFKSTVDTLGNVSTTLTTDKGRFKDTIDTLINGFTSVIDTPDSGGEILDTGILATTTLTRDQAHYRETLTTTASASNQNTDLRRANETLTTTINETNQNTDRARRSETVSTTIAETNQNADQGRFKEATQQTNCTVTNQNADLVRRQDTLTTTITCTTPFLNVLHVREYPLHTVSCTTTLTERARLHDINFTLINCTTSLFESADIEIVQYWGILNILV